MKSCWYKCWRKLGAAEGLGGSGVSDSGNCWVAGWGGAGLEEPGGA